MNPGSRCHVPKRSLCYKLAASGECSVASLRAEIGTANDFRKQVLQHFDELVRQGRITEVVNKAKEHSAKLARLTTERVRRRRKSRMGNKKYRTANYLTEEKRQQIRAMCAGGFTRAQIARRFLTSGTTVGRILEAQA
jgi:hypothetical protein